MFRMRAAVPLGALLMVLSTFIWGSLPAQADLIVPTFSASATPNTVTYGTSVTLAAMSLPSDATGTVTFTDGPLQLCQATVSAGAASGGTPTTLPVASYSVTASYSGDTNYAVQTEST